MAENLTVARPYAEAVFAVAVKENSFDKWQSMLFSMAVACRDDFFKDYLKNSPNPNSAAESLISLLKDLLDQSGQNFIKLLGENNRFEVLPEIFEEFQKLREEHDKVLTVQLTSARPFSDSEISALKDKLAAKYNCSIRLKQNIEPNIIGGAILKMGDKVIDASVKTSLDNLSSTLR